MEIQRKAILLVIPFMDFSLFLQLQYSTGLLAAATPIGVCYDHIATNQPPPSDLITLLQANGISKIRLYNPDREALSPFHGTDIELTIGIPNDLLPILANATINAAISWLQSNIFTVVNPNQVRYITVGNEILLKEPFYVPYLIPVILKLHQALSQLGLENIIKLSSAHGASILATSYPPSTATFDPKFTSILIPLLQFLHDTAAPLMVNVYPFYTYINSSDSRSTQDFALFRSGTIEFDQNLVYTNLFDAMIDAFVYAMEKEGFRNIPVTVTETGWPTDGGEAAGAEMAMAYNGNVVARANANMGTPKRPEVGIEVFLYGLFDENEKHGSEYEKHFGIFGVDGSKAYDIRFE